LAFGGGLLFATVPDRNQAFSGGSRPPRCITRYPDRALSNDAADGANTPHRLPPEANLVLARGPVHRLASLAEAGLRGQTVAKTAEIVDDRGEAAGPLGSSTNHRQPDARRSPIEEVHL
jgi:hypothetical protein